ncbi:MAG: hypothetical protein ACI8Z1_003290 [Candidatus Azotimanducaceae bacterium]|jgi:hypothetical protein
MRGDARRQSSNTAIASFARAPEQRAGHQLVDKADRKTAWEFLQHLLKAAPYRIHTILTDNGIPFAEQPRNRNTAYSRQMRFHMICEANGIKQRLTQAKPSVDQWPGRADEPHDQRGDGEAIPLRQSQPAADASRGLHGSLQLRARAQDARRPHAALRIHL